MARPELTIGDMIVADSLGNKVQKPRKPKTATDPPKPNPDTTWQKRMKDSMHGKPRDPAKKNPPGMFTQSPSQIALDLKNHSKDYDEAQKKLNSYINRQGRNLQGKDRKDVYDAKEHLENAYGIHRDSNGKIINNGSETQAAIEQSIYALPPGHNKDDGMIDPMAIVPDSREKREIEDPFSTLSRTRSRLRSSIQNTTQNPQTRMSSVETDADSTLTPNLDEDQAPDVFGDDALAIMQPSPTGHANGGHSTSDGLDDSFNEIHQPSPTAYASAASILKTANLVARGLK